MSFVLIGHRTEMFTTAHGKGPSTHAHSQIRSGINQSFHQSFVEVVEWNKMVPSLPLLSCELSMSVKENPDRKKKKKKNHFTHLYPGIKVMLKRKQAYF